MRRHLCLRTHCFLLKIVEISVSRKLQVRASTIRGGEVVFDARFMDVVCITAAVKAYLDAKRREPDVGKFADFHLLLYLAELLDVEVLTVHAC